MDHVLIIHAVKDYAAWKHPNLFTCNNLTAECFEMDEQFEKGLQMRKQVMGEDFVEKAFANATDFTLPLQEFVTRNAWGTVWCRDGLDLKTRSLITLAMLTALGRSHEIKGHVRGAVNNGASVDEIRELLLHASVYCGMPLAIDAFRAAQEVLADLIPPAP
jgi:4-carboxymuconolactone decarboxylase